MSAENFSEEVRREFEELLANAKSDAYISIRNSAAALERAMSLYQQGLLQEDDVKTLLEKYLRIAQIEANSAAIELKARIQRIVFRLLTLGIIFLVQLVRK